MRLPTAKHIRETLIGAPAHVGRWPKSAHIPQALPGFELAVTADDLRLWCIAVAPHISAERRARYIIDYDVTGKVRRAIQDGLWPDIKARALDTLSKQ